MCTVHITREANGRRMPHIIRSGEKMSSHTCVYAGHQSGTIPSIPDLSVPPFDLWTPAIRNLHRK